MPLFLDRHNVPGVTPTEIAEAHKLDLAVQEDYGVRYLTYWFDDDDGTAFCLAEGPNRESPETVHRESHGLVADNIIEVGEGSINAFLGATPKHQAGDAYVESAVRAILFTDLCDSTKQTQELGDEGYMALPSPCRASRPVWWLVAPGSRPTRSDEPWADLLEP